MKAARFLGLLSIFFFSILIHSTVRAIIVTAAGGGRDPASIRMPMSVAVAENGDLLIADAFNHAILRANSAGKIAIVAGGNGAGFSGDGGLADQAQLRSPNGVTPDGAGGYLIADTNNNRIRRVDAKGIIATVAGNGVAGFSGDGGPATQAMLQKPLEASPDGSYGILIADSDNHRIRRVDAKGIITTVAGNGEMPFSGDGGSAAQSAIGTPHGAVSDGAGGFLFADPYANKIRRADANGRLTTFAGTGEAGFSGDGGPAAKARLQGPVRVSPDGAGGYFIADFYNNRVRRVDANGIITTVVGNEVAGKADGGGSATPAPIFYPQDVVSDGAGGMFVVDSYESRVYRITASGVLATIDRTGEPSFFGDGGTATKAQFNGPTSVMSDGAGGFLVADTFNNRIRRVDASGIVSTVAGYGDTGWNDGGFSGDGGPSSLAQLKNPYCVVSDGAGGYFIADTNNNRIRRVDANGIISTVAGTGEAGFSGDGGLATQALLNSPNDVSPDGAGGYYIADTFNHRIRRVDANGIIATVAGVGLASFYERSGIATEAYLDTPRGMSSDGAGGFFIADTFNHCIQRVDADGRIAVVAGTREQGYSGDGGQALKARLNDPSRAIPDGSGGYLIADTGNNRIRRVYANGIIETVAGSDDWGFSGDGGSATQAMLNSPYGVALDGTGGILIADMRNNRIRRATLTRYLNGDANGDGKVDIQDASLILQFATGLRSPDSDQRIAADLNGDGKVNLKDAVLELRKAIGF